MESNSQSVAISHVCGPAPRLISYCFKYSINLYIIAFIAIFTPSHSHRATVNVYSSGQSDLINVISQLSPISLKIEQRTTSKVNVVVNFFYESTRLGFIIKLGKACSYILRWNVLCVCEILRVVFLLSILNLCNQIISKASKQDHYQIFENYRVYNY